MGSDKKRAKGFEFQKFATPRIIGGIAIVVIVLWALTIIFGSPEGPSSQSHVAHQEKSVATTAHSQSADPETSPRQTDHSARDQAESARSKTSDAHQKKPAESPFTPVDLERHRKTAAPDTSKPETFTTHEVAARVSAATDEHDTAGQPMVAVPKSAGGHRATDEKASADSHKPAPHATTDAKDHGTVTHKPEPVHKTTDGHVPSHGGRTGTSAKAVGSATEHHGPAVGHGAGSPKATKDATSDGHPLPGTAAGAPTHKPTPKGVAFVEATIQPLNYELEERWWGWRPNDLINVTDNINTFQLGVLEVTRRTTMALSERISRTGTTDAYDENLEQAVNWLMVKAGSYWFPSAESKYKDSIEELQTYLEKLKVGKATFYTRTDNLIPLLATFEELLGSCDENLVKESHEDGSPVSFFAVDDYFYYTQGVASAMATILEAVHHDFLLTLESRNATELLHHAVASCQRAAALDPWFVLDRDLSSIFANHRANMAAPISHARFYLGQLIKTLST